MIVQHLMIRMLHDPKYIIPVYTGHAGCWGYPQNRVLTFSPKPEPISNSTLHPKPQALKAATRYGGVRSPRSYCMVCKVAMRQLQHFSIQLPSGGVPVDCVASTRVQLPMVLAKATSIHKSQAATLHDGVHSRVDATCKEEGQAYVALCRAPHRPSAALCTLQFFSPKSLRCNANAEWALTKLKALKRQTYALNPEP